MKIALVCLSAIVCTGSFIALYGCSVSAPETSAYPVGGEQGGPGTPAPALGVAGWLQGTLDSEFSGIPTSADVPAFRPLHLTGPFTGRDVCPVCTNGNAPQVQIWVGQKRLQAGLDLASALQAEVPENAAASLPVYLVVVGGDGDSILELAGFTAGIMILHVASIEQSGTALYQVNQDTATTTVHWVTNRRVYARDVNLEPANVPNRWNAIWPKLKHHSSPYEVTQYHIAPPWEPGERMVLTGRVLDAEGEAIVHGPLRAWQTNASGNYNEPGNGRQEPTLAGLLWTDDDGAYRWETIKPAPYPSLLQPAHIHMGLERDDQPTFWRTLWFEGDPLLDAKQRKWAANDAETVIIDLKRVKGVWVGAHDIVVGG